MIRVLHIRIQPPNPRPPGGNVVELPNLELFPTRSDWFRNLDALGSSHTLKMSSESSDDSEPCSHLGTEFTGTIEAKYRKLVSWSISRHADGKGHAKRRKVIFESTYIVMSRSQRNQDCSAYLRHMRNITISTFRLPTLLIRWMLVKLPCD